MKYSTSFKERMTGRDFDIDVKGTIPDFVTGLDFMGYDSSGVTRDPKGVLRLRETSTRSRDSGFPNLFDRFEILYTKNDFSDLFGKSDEYKVSRTVLDAEVLLLAEQINEMNSSPYIEYDFSSKKRNNLDRFNMFRDVQEQVETSLEDPRTFREHFGTLVGNPVIDGVEFTVQMGQVQHQIGEGMMPYFLKGREYVVNDGNKQVLANRYHSDPRVVVACSFEGDYRRPTNTSGEFELDEKRTLMKLFKQLVPEIHEVTFPDNTRIRTD